MWIPNYAREPGQRLATLPWTLAVTSPSSHLLFTNTYPYRSTLQLVALQQHNVVTVHAMKGHMESRGTAPRSRNFGARLGEGVSFQRADPSALTPGTNSGTY
jgi:hypothetical protein